MPKIECERDKYLWIYSFPNTGYAKANHGRNAYPIIERLAPDTLLDVGCGGGRFVDWAKTKGIDAAGMDFASGYDVEGDILDMPFADNSFDIVTAFDSLEHLLPEDLDRGLSEMNRVAKSLWVISIGYGTGNKKMGDGTVMRLHPIFTKKPDWWIPYFEKYGDVVYEGLVYPNRPNRTDTYILVYLNK